MNAIQLTQCYCHHERAEGRMELVESDASVRPAEQREDGREMVVTAACSVLVVGTIAVTAVLNIGGGGGGGRKLV